ncbi:hypothetical protein sscle_01g011080 [Sclerotinia sclerotiorum 1980 UF-70]|uniref:AB hydrolase-1 domain-containing protein n=2 Tax=Sclerotinia sclerotiorum (strain ATCC 18683 / 1980 / Ss-1) TaxID=665079 RepID=A0A1D9PUE5_SCLS1|nr:hypothetical protein sscle_01g011080 [Sclerotinia sclerotiorum 1980 UF-70]
METPPPIPYRSRRRKSLSGPSAHSSNRVSIQPASPEVISSLITSLSIISSPANELFENHSTSVSPTTSPTFFTHSDLRPSYTRTSSGGSFGIDYGAFRRPSLRELVEEESLDELAASPPVVKTAKPPSGFSPLTAPKSPAADSRSNSLKNFLRRPSSKGSQGSKEKDESSTIGNLSIESGYPPTPKLERKRSTESWDKKQARNHKGLMYMSSKERLRENASDKKRNLKGLGLDRIAIPNLDQPSFMAETPITEEPLTIGKHTILTLDTTNTSPVPRLWSPSLANSPGGIGSGRFIPPRDSSLRKPAAQTKKRDSKLASRQSDMEREKQKNTTNEYDEGPDQKQESSTESGESTNLKVPSEGSVPSPSLESTTLANKQFEETTKNNEHLVFEDDIECAPAPVITQRRSQRNQSPNKSKRSSSQKRQSGGISPEPPELKIKRSTSRLKRLSAPLSPGNLNNDTFKRNTSKPDSKYVSSDPARPASVFIDARPSSADSIDDAVTAYLASPRLSQKIRHPQSGRTISFSEVGDPEGSVVFCCVGMGLTRYITAFYDELALALKLRLVTPDRPGVGQSEPYTDGTATPLSWPDDVYAICQALRITKFSILAHSAGAIYALATALRMPQHIRGRIHLLAPWIPPSQLTTFGTQTVSPPANSIPTSQRILRALPTTILKVANSSFMSATSSSVTSSLPKQKRNKRKSTSTPRDTPTPSGRNNVLTPGLDKENQKFDPSKRPEFMAAESMEEAAGNPNDPNHDAAILAVAASTLADKERQMTYDTRLTHAIWDLATIGANPAVDLLVCLERRHTIGFRYVDITRSTVIHHGSKDTRVPVENVRWLGKTMKRCEVRVLEGEGHGLMASATVMGGVLMEIAREWEDWIEITGSTRGDGTKRTLRERASVGAFR